MDNDVQLLSDRLDELGVESISIQNDEVRGLCPFHDEGSPSFWVHPTRGAFCFGCGAKHTTEGLLKVLSDREGITYEPLSDDVDYIFSFLDEAPELEAEPLNPRILSSYREDTEHFISNWGVTEDVVIRRRLRIDPESGAECFPIVDRGGLFWGFVERYRGHKRSLYRYPTNFKKSSVLLGEDDVSDEIWVVEGVRDLCAIESKIPGSRAVALGGCVPSSVQLKRLLFFDKVILCLDNDEPGRKGQDTIIGTLPPTNIYVARYTGKDPADEESGFTIKHSVFG